MDKNLKQVIDSLTAVAVGCKKIAELDAARVKQAAAAKTAASPAQPSPADLQMLETISNKVAAAFDVTGPQQVKVVLGTYSGTLNLLNQVLDSIQSAKTAAAVAAADNAVGLGQPGKADSKTANAPTKRPQGSRSYR